MRYWTQPKRKPSFCKERHAQRENGTSFCGGSKERRMLFPQGLLAWSGHCSSCEFAGVAESPILRAACLLWWNRRSLARSSRRSVGAAGLQQPNNCHARKGKDCVIFCSVCFICFAESGIVVAAPPADCAWTIVLSLETDAPTDHWKWKLPLWLIESRQYGAFYISAHQAAWLNEERIGIHDVFFSQCRHQMLFFTRRKTESQSEDSYLTDIDIYNYGILLFIEFRIDFL